MNFNVEGQYIISHYRDNELVDELTSKNIITTYGMNRLSGAGYDRKIENIVHRVPGTNIEYLHQYSAGAFKQAAMWYDPNVVANNPNYTFSAPMSSNPMVTLAISPTTGSLYYPNAFTGVTENDMVKVFDKNLADKRPYVIRYKEFSFYRNTLSGPFNVIGLGDVATRIDLPGIGLCDIVIPSTYALIADLNGNPVTLNLDEKDSINIEWQVKCYLPKPASTPFSFKVNDKTITGTCSVIENSRAGHSLILTAEVIAGTDKDITTTYTDGYAIWISTTNPNGTNTTTMTYRFDYDNANFTNGISHIRLNTPYGDYLYLFDSPLMKDDTMSWDIAFTFNYSQSRE